MLSEIQGPAIRTILFSHRANLERLKVSPSLYLEYPGSGKQYGAIASGAAVLNWNSRRSHRWGLAICGWSATRLAWLIMRRCIQPHLQLRSKMRLGSRN